MMFYPGAIPPQAPTQSDPAAYRLPIGIWKGHPLAELAATTEGRAYLQDLLRREPAAVSADLKARIRAVLGMGPAP